MTDERTAGFESSWLTLSKRARDIAYFLACSRQAGNFHDRETTAHFLGVNEAEFDKLAKELSTHQLLHHTTFRAELQKAARGEHILISNNGHQWSPDQAQKLLNREGSDAFLDEPRYYLQPEDSSRVIEKVEADSPILDLTPEPVN